MKRPYGSSINRRALMPPPPSRRCCGRRGASIAKHVGQAFLSATVVLTLRVRQHHHAEPTRFAGAPAYGNLRHDLPLALDVIPHDVAVEIFARGEEYAALGALGQPVGKADVFLRLRPARHEE